MRVVLLFILAAVSLFAADVKVAVAANVQNVFGNLEKAFATECPDAKLLATFGPSGAFAAQIKNGAPFDLFLSADMKFPDELFTLKLTTEKPVVYAQGVIALFSAQKLDLSKGIEILKDPKIVKISIANPQTAPYGRASVEAMKNANVYNEKKLVQAENIGQVFAQTLSAADIGFVAKSTFFTPTNRYKENENWISVDPSLHTPIEQGIVLMKASEKNLDARKFYDFILSKKGKEIFANYGYNVK